MKTIKSTSIIRKVRKDKWFLIYVMTKIKLLFVKKTETTNVWLKIILSGIMIGFLFRTKSYCSFGKNLFVKYSRSTFIEATRLFLRFLFLYLCKLINIQ